MTSSASDSELVWSSACDLADLVRSGKASAREVVAAHLAQIERVNPVVNAIVTLDAERASDAAAAADERHAAGDAALGILHGLPVVHKDVFVTRGLRTTFGSPLYRDHVPDTDALIVERLKAAGAITVGKSNTPEFGAGSQTFNPVFGATHNPYDLTKTCGGSSGGAAVALASGMVPIADGSDVGGSLRNPASFCNVVGLRPSAGRVPAWPAELPSPLGVQGPMGRSVADVALQLEAIAGPDPRVALSIDAPGSFVRGFAGDLDTSVAPIRLAWSLDLGGLPIAREVRDALEPLRDVFADRRWRVIEQDPPLDGAEEVFRTLRAWQFAHVYGALVDRAPESVKATVRWNVEEGRRLSGGDVARAFARYGQLHEHMAAFMHDVDALITTTVQVTPFDLTAEYPASIDGVQMDTYIDWMRSCYLISATGLPAISIPAAFTPSGLPVGVQLIGSFRGERRLLAIASAVEAAAGDVGRRRPPGL